MANGIGNQYGRMIAVVRTLRGWTQSRLSEKSNVAPRYLSRYENDKEMISQIHLDRIEDALGIDFGKLRPEYERFVAAVLDNGNPAASDSGDRGLA